ncbi:MAG: fibro-slime domain-containing protein [Lachnospiraceae bacterium]|nr:fibro-slime domain-containing protein [Lachnospiraceae bacterium]
MPRRKVRGGHSHTEECYDKEGNLICGLEESEGHIHTDECYVTEKVLTCGLEETEGHTHTEECYETERDLICTLEECEGHTHTDACYESVLVCGLEEHTHTVECLMDETADAETASVWEATIPALSGIWPDDVVAVAQSQLGYTESTANFVLAEDGETHKGYTRYGAWYGNAYGGWDAMFVSFCLSYAGVPESEFPQASGAYAWSAELSSRSLYQSASGEEAYVPSAGDLVFFDNDNDGKADHVGILEKVTTQTDAATGEVTAAKLFVIEGDFTSDNADAADTVARNEYSPDDKTILGYGVLPSNAPDEAEREETTAAAEDAAEFESESLAEVESESESEDLAELETEPESENSTKVETENESESEDFMDAETESESEDFTDAETESESENSMEVETETESEGSAEIETESESERENLTEAETETETETESESESENLTERVFKKDGLTVTVTYGPEAEISDGAALMVSEYEQDSDLWQSRYEEITAYFEWDEEAENAEDVADAEDTESAETAENADGSENSENVEAVASAENGENAETSEAAGTTENAGAAEGTEDSENLEKAEDTDTTDTTKSAEISRNAQLRVFSIYLYEDGQKIQPAEGTQVQVTMEFSDADDLSSSMLLSFAGEELSALEAEYSCNEETQIQTIQFSLSTFAQAGVGLLIPTDESPEEETEIDESDELTTQTAEGEDYIITVTYGPEAELPEEAVLMVSEYEQDSETWQARYAEAAALYGWEDADTETLSETSADSTDVISAADAGSATGETSGTETDTNSEADTVAQTGAGSETGTTVETGASSETGTTSETGATSEKGTSSETEATDHRNEFRLFKIGFYVDGEEVEPAADVTVTIVFPDKEDEATYQVTHFGDDETTDVSVESVYEENTQTITFDTDGFSEYGIATVDLTENGITYTEVSTFYLWIKDYSNTTVAAYSEWETASDHQTISGVLSYTEGSETYYLIPISYFTDALSSYGYTFDGTNTDFCPFMYIPNANNSGVANATGEASYVQVNGSWYVRVQDTGTYSGSTVKRSNVYYMLETVSTFRVWPRTAVGTTAMGTNDITNVVLQKTNTTYYYIPMSYVETWFSFTFDVNNLESCPFYYAPNANSGSANLTQARYVYINGSWYLEIQDTGFGTNYSDYPRSNLYYFATDSVVLNLGNGNGTSQDADYTGTKSSSDALRYTTDSLSDYADTDGKVTINLPSDSDLGKTFTVVNGSGNLTDATVTLGTEAAYDYELVGWFNIATGEYYSVENGSTTAEVDLSNANVFYADWIAADYDKGTASAGTLVEDTVDTSDFVRIYMFDYNELFNLYSASLSQLGLTSETWTDSGTLYSSLILNNDESSLTEIGDSFLFVNVGIASAGMLSVPSDREDWNFSRSYVAAASKFGIDNPDSALLQMLFNTSAGNTGDDLGVYYVGEGNYLFSIDNNANSSTYGFYYYNSSENAAVYNQSEERFYVYDGKANYGSGGGFYPYNSYTDTLIANNGSINEWFGMNVELDFYLPNAPSSSGSVNQVNGEDMVFNFSGDDDVWVFVDDKLVLDIGGIHGSMSGSINFASGDVTVNGTTTEGLLQSLGITSGTHRLSIFYMERGGYASDLELSFNTIPRWLYETATAGTISVTKDWGESTTTTEVTMGLFERMDITDKTVNADDTTTYTVSNVSYLSTTTYTVQSDGYSYANDGSVQAYYSGGYLYVLVDKQVLNNDNNWSYVWALLDTSKTYQVLELTTLLHYSATYTSSALQSYDYWTVIDTDDLQEMLESASYSVGDSAGTIVLSDGAINYTSVDQFGRAEWGYVIAAGDGAISIEKVLLSEPPTNNGSDAYIYGAMSDDIDEGGIPATAKWEMIITGSRQDDSVVPNPQRYTFYLKNGNYYLRVTGDSTNGYNVTLTTNESEATDFYYNSLGELQINDDSGIKIILQNSGGTVSAVVVASKAEAETSNIKVYYETPNSTTKGTAYTVTNTELPAVYLKKVADDTNSTALSGASFALYKVTDDGTNTTTLYYTWDSTNEKASWVESTSAEQVALTTDDSGWISFYDVEDGTYYLLETAAPDGYNMLTYVIKFVVENGEITEVTDEDSNSLSAVTIKKNSSDEALIIQVVNKTEEILPETGGVGSTPYTMAGMMLLIGSACVLLYRKRKYAGRSPNG